MPSTPLLRTHRLSLTPLSEQDATSMVRVLGDPALYDFTGGRPPTEHELAARYRYQVAGSLTPDEIWHNWVVRLEEVAVGFVQATVTGQQADLAWLIGVRWQRQGLASEAAIAVRDWFTGEGLTDFTAHIHVDHRRSVGVATRLGLEASGRLDVDGEMIWISKSPAAPGDDGG